MKAVGSNRPFANALATEKKAEHVTADSASKETERRIKVALLSGRTYTRLMPPRRDGEKWSREEHILAFNLYCKIPFGAIHMHNPRVIELARLLGRSVGSVSLKLSNFARLDPALQARGIRGMTHGSKGEGEIWHEFAESAESLAFESERLLAARLGKPLEEVAGLDTQALPAAGSDREAIMRVRVNQSFFRSRILSAYNYRCCVTGLSVEPLLVASHVVPWSEDPANRLNPRNGLCSGDRARARKYTNPGPESRLGGSLALPVLRAVAVHRIPWSSRDAFAGAVQRRREREQRWSGAGLRAQAESRDGQWAGAGINGPPVAAPGTRLLPPNRRSTALGRPGHD